HDDFAAIGECRHGSEIRHVARREEQRSLAPCELGELFLEALMLDAVSRDEMGCTRAAAECGSALGHGGGNLRMPSETQVVIAAEIDETSAIDHDFAASVRRGKRSDHAARAPQMLAIDLRQRVF